MAMTVEHGHTYNYSVFVMPYVTVGSLSLLLSLDATPSMVLTSNSVNENTPTIDVCLDPGVSGAIELMLVTTLDASDIKAGKSPLQTLITNIKAYLLPFVG